MRFSIVICTYNRAKYLPKTLSSVCEQSYDNSRHEIVVIDNNSIDNSLEVCQSFIDKHPTKQLRYFKEAAQGLSHALNRAIKEVKGEFIIYIDDDETVESEHLEQLDQYLNQYPEASFCASPVIPIYEIAEPKWMSPFTQRLIGGYFKPSKQAIKLKKNKYPGTGHTIIRRELYDRCGDYNTNLGRKGKGLIGAEDKDMAFRLAAANVDCYYFPDIPIYHHIPAYKLSNSFFEELTFSIGRSERRRTLAVSEKKYKKRLLLETIKWVASVFLFLFYLVTLRPAKGWKLLEFRKQVTKGLITIEGE